MRLPLRWLKLAAAAQLFLNYVAFIFVQTTRPACGAKSLTAKDRRACVYRATAAPD
jgi:hypothetical protein